MQKACNFYRPFLYSLKTHISCFTVIRTGVLLLFFTHRLMTKQQSPIPICSIPACKDNTRITMPVDILLTFETSRINDFEARKQSAL